MAYKDSEKQREKVLQAVKKHRAKAKGITEGITDGRVLQSGITVVKCESGGYITLDKFVDGGWVELLKYMGKNVQPEYRERVFIGVGGGTLGEYMKIADVVGVV